MKKYVLIAFLFGPFLFCTPLSGQILKTLGDKAKMKVGQRANQKVDNAMDKGLDKAEEGAKGNQVDDETKAKEAVGTKTDPRDESKNKAAGGSIESTPKLSYNSKYDFVPGEKVVAFEDFNSVATGDFPANWNTNATAEVVTTNAREGKWMKLNKEGIWHPEFINSLPENFTLEFDLGVNNEWNSQPFVLNLTHLTSPEAFTDFGHYVNYKGIPTIHLEFAPANGQVSAWSRIFVSKDGNSTVNNTTEFSNWDNGKTQFAHIALWRQKQRLRVYVNGEKIWDIPRAFEPAAKYTALTTALQASYRKDDYFLLGNMRLAVGAADTRSKLIDDGKFVTRGIYFATGTEEIKPESYGVLRDIGKVLKENPSVKVKIFGHTDADGDEKKNMDLSRRRAAAVKTYLVTEQAISELQLETDGKGESSPVDSNATSEGKANNRRVEFVKL